MFPVLAVIATDPRLVFVESFGAAVLSIDDTTVITVLSVLPGLITKRTQAKHFVFERIDFGLVYVVSLSNDNRTYLVLAFPTEGIGR